MPSIPVPLQRTRVSLPNAVTGNLVASCQPPTTFLATPAPMFSSIYKSNIIALEFDRKWSGSLGETIGALYQVIAGNKCHGTLDILCMTQSSTEIFFDLEIDEAHFCRLGWPHQTDTEVSILKVWTCYALIPVNPVIIYQLFYHQCSFFSHPSRCQVCKSISKYIHQVFLLSSFKFL